VPTTIDSELLPIVLLITDQVSKPVPHVFLLPLQQKDFVPDPSIHPVPFFFLSPLSFHWAELRSGEDLFATVPFKVLV
jgi:hypothetical protein